MPTLAFPATLSVRQHSRHRLPLCYLKSHFRVTGHLHIRFECTSVTLLSWLLMTINRLDFDCKGEQCPSLAKQKVLLCTVAAAVETQNPGTLVEEHYFTTIKGNHKLPRCRENHLRNLGRPDQACHMVCSLFAFCQPPPMAYPVPRCSKPTFKSPLRRHER